MWRAKQIAQKSQDFGYLIENIEDKKVNALTQKTAYLVKWQNFTSSQNTWESKEKLLEDGQDSEIETYEANSLAEKLLYKAEILENLLKQSERYTLPITWKKISQQVKDELEPRRLNQEEAILIQNANKEISVSNTQDTANGVEQEKKSVEQRPPFGMKLRSQQ